MHKLVLVVVMVAALALALSGSASDGEIAAGSAKTDVDVVVGGVHASFGAHTDITDLSDNCAATGHITYNDVTGEDFAGDIVVLDTNGLPPPEAEVFMFAQVTKVNQGTLVNVGDFVSFYASDSGQPGGMGDTFAMGIDYGTTVTPTCAPPAPGDPITSGNIVIKTKT